MLTKCNLSKVGVGLCIALLIALLAGCAKEPEWSVKAENQEPETFISSVSITKVSPKADPIGTKFLVTVEYYGEDRDGRVKAYRHKIGKKGEEVPWPTDPKGKEIWEIKFTSTDTVIFESKEDVYIYYVQCKDDLDVVDPTPATAELSLTRYAIANVAPETKITMGPPNGAITSGGVSFELEGTDYDGLVVAFEYSIDGSPWIEVEATIDTLARTGKATVEFSEAQGNILAEGSHTFAARAKDNLGTVDGTPDARNFLVKPGFKPIIIFTAGPKKGGGWFAGVPAPFAWDAIVKHYNGAIAGYRWGFDSYTVLTDWNLTPKATIGADSVTPGSHFFYLEVKDLAGTVVTDTVDFTAAAFQPTEGILVVNGVAPLYGAEIESAYEDSVFWGNHAVHFWDLFGTMNAPAIPTIPTGAYIGGGAALTPDILAKYSSVVWIGNNYAGDLAYWEGSPMYPYLLAGGNLLLACRLSHFFIDEEMRKYLNIAWRETGYTYNIVLKEYEPVFPGLLPMTPFTRGMSWTDVWSAGGFLDSTDDNTVTNWDGVSSYTKGTLIHTLLFAHRSNKYNPDYPFSYVRGLGVWAHPNLVYASTRDATLPTPGTDEAKGNFILLAARPYGYDHANGKANFDFILTNIFCEP